MTTNQLNSGLGQPNSSKMSILGILFFMMGSPNLYAFFNRRAATPTYSGNGTPRYLLVVLLAMAIAGLVELSVI